MDSSIETSEIDGLQRVSQIQRLKGIKEKVASRLDPKVKAESLVHYSREKTLKYLNTTKQGEQAFVKASNVLLEPFSPIKRGVDVKAEKQLRMPANPVGNKSLLSGTTLISLPEFCKQRNIPWNQNEQRYYLRAKNEVSKQAY